MPTLTLTIKHTVTVKYEDLELFLFGLEGVSDRTPTGQTKPKINLIWEQLCKQKQKIVLEDKYSQLEDGLDSLPEEVTDHIVDTVQEIVSDLDDEEEEMNKKYPHLQERCVLCDKVLTDAYEFWRSPKPLKQEGNCCLECYYDKVVPAVGTK